MVNAMSFLSAVGYKEMFCDVLGLFLCIKGFQTCGRFCEWKGLTLMVYKEGNSVFL
jgi:hypothetical protein